MIWYDESDDKFAHALQDYTEYHGDNCFKKLQEYCPGINRSVAKCIAYAIVENEEYALDIYNKAFIEDRELYSILEWKERIEECALKDSEQIDADNNDPIWDKDDDDE